MKITEPIVIRKLKTQGYEATGRIEGRGVIRRRARSEEEAKERFFQAMAEPAMRRLPGRA